MTKQHLALLHVPRSCQDYTIACLVLLPQVILVSLFIALVFKTPNAEEDADLEEDEEECELRQDEEWLHTLYGKLPCCTSQFALLHSLQFNPLTPLSLHKMGALHFKHTSILIRTFFAASLGLS